MACQFRKRAFPSETSSIADICEKGASSPGASGFFFQDLFLGGAKGWGVWLTVQEGVLRNV